MAISPESEHVHDHGTVILEPRCRIDTEELVAYLEGQYYVEREDDVLIIDGKYLIQASPDEVRQHWLCEEPQKTETGIRDYLMEKYKLVDILEREYASE